MPIPMEYQILLTYSNEDELIDELESHSPRTARRPTVSLRYPVC